MKKHRATSFTRLLLFLIVFLPIAWVAINVAKGDDPLVEFKKAVGISTDKAKTNYPKSSEELTIEMQRTEIENLKKELELCKEAQENQ